MIKFEQVKGIIDEVSAKLNQIAEKMSKYSKIDTDYRASALIEEINTKLNKCITLITMFLQAKISKQLMAKKVIMTIPNMLKWFVITSQNMKRFIKKLSSLKVCLVFTIKCSDM